MRIMFINAQKWMVGLIRLKTLCLIAFSCVMISVMTPSCDSDLVGDSYYTFKGERIGEYLRNHPDQFSEFVKLLDTTKVMGLLNAYGDYTCFAPTNDALFEFYQSKGRQSIEEFPKDSIKTIVYNHLVKGAAMTTSDFPNGVWSLLTMSNRNIETVFVPLSNGQFEIQVNSANTIITPNVELHNGVVHVLGGVVQPTNKKLMEVIEKDTAFSLFHSAIVETGLFEKLQLVEDETYNPADYNFPNQGLSNRIGGMLMTVPDFKRYGYTVLMESDATMKKNGIQSLDDLKEYADSVYKIVYPLDQGITDVKDPRNSLNRFVAYHLFNKSMSRTRFLQDFYLGIKQTIQTYDMYEYIETMCPNTMIEVRTIVSQSQYGAINYNSKDGSYIKIVESNSNKQAINGFYHEIDGMLCYTYDVASEIASKRLRLDVSSFFPEFTNNNLRGRGVANRMRYIIPPGYAERLSINEGTELQYMTANDGPGTFQGDELNAVVDNAYDITITTPSIPAGMYEVRLGYQPNGNRGVVQLYWDGFPTGIPLDLRIDASDPRVGYGANGDDLAGWENDKMMRNRGYMKGPMSVRSGDWYPAANLRVSPSNLRRILGIYEFDKPKEHKLRIKAVKSGQFQLDFIEFVPTEILEKEGVD